MAAAAASARGLGRHDRRYRKVIEFIRQHPDAHPTARFRYFTHHAFPCARYARVWRTGHDQSRRFPVIRPKGVDAINTEDVLACLKPIWQDIGGHRVQLERMCEVVVIRSQSAWSMRLAVKTRRRPKGFRGFVLQHLGRGNQRHNRPLAFSTPPFCPTTRRRHRTKWSWRTWS
jgi:hypothetical protein